MKYEKKYCSKVEKSKILYKIFAKEGEGLKPLAASHSFIYAGTKGALNVHNAKGFESLKVIGELVMCQNGFHAVEKKYINEWTDSWSPARVYKVKLFNCWRRKGLGHSDGKWVGTHFQILQRVSKYGAKPRRWRD